MGFKSGHSLRVSRETDDDSVRCCFRLKRRLDSPLGILNLLSFLYHKHPRSVFTILTGNSESGQSEVFRVKSVAAARRRKTSSWVWQTADSVAVVFYSLCRWILSSDHNLCLTDTDRWICSQQEGGDQGWVQSLQPSAAPTRLRGLMTQIKQPGLIQVWTNTRRS